MDSLVTRDAELLEHAERSLAGRVGLRQNDEVLDIELPARGAHGAVGGSRHTGLLSLELCDESCRTQMRRGQVRTNSAVRARRTQAGV